MPRVDDKERREFSEWLANDGNTMALWADEQTVSQYDVDSTME
jgi:hypothetical protein